MGCPGVQRGIVAFRSVNVSGSARPGSVATCFIQHTSKSPVRYQNADAAPVPGTFRALRSEDACRLGVTRESALLDRPSTRSVCRSGHLACRTPMPSMSSAAGVSPRGASGTRSADVGCAFWATRRGRVPMLPAVSEHRRPAPGDRPGSPKRSAVPRQRYWPVGLSPIGYSWSCHSGACKLHARWGTVGEGCRFGSDASSYTKQRWRRTP